VVVVWLGWGDCTRIVFFVSCYFSFIFVLVGCVVFVLGFRLGGGSFVISWKNLRTHKPSEKKLCRGGPGKI